MDDSKNDSSSIGNDTFTHSHENEVQFLHKGVLNHDRKWSEGYFMSNKLRRVD